MRQVDADRGNGTKSTTESDLDITFLHAPVGIAHLGLDGRVLRVNDSLCALLGYERDELLALGRADVVEVDDAAADADRVDRLIDGTLPRHSRPVRLHRKHGGPMHAVLSEALVHDAAGAGTYLLAVFESASELGEADRRYRVQVAVSRALADAEQVATAMPRVLGEVAGTLGWHFGTYWVIDPATETLRAEATWRVSEQVATEFERTTREQRFPRGVGLPGRVWATARPAWITDVLADGNFPRQAVARREGLHAAFAFPVFAHGAVLGVLEFFCDSIVPPNAALLDVAEGVGHQIGQFIARREALEAERASEIRKAAILGTALDSIISIDHRGVVLEFNPAAEATFGYRRADVIGRSMAELIVPPELREAHYRGLARYLATGEAHVVGRRIEITAMRADGSLFPVELAITRVALPGPPVFTAYMRDLTERRRLEARQRVLLEASAALVARLDDEHLLDALVDVVVPTFADWMLVDVIGSGDQLTRQQMRHRDPALRPLLAELAAQGPGARAASGIWRAIRSGEHALATQSADAEALLAGDESRPGVLRALGLTSCMVVPLAGRDGALGALTLARGAGASAFDADDLALGLELARRASQALENAALFRQVEESREQLEQQATELETQATELEMTASELETSNYELRRANEDLERWAKEAQQARADADRASRAKSEFLATMSHELRTPLNAIVGYTQLLEMGVRGPVSEDQGEDLRRIGRSAQYLLGLITDILNFSKVEAGRAQYTIESVPLDEVLSSAEELIAPQAETKRLQYRRRPSSGTVVARADRDKVLQIVLNLLSNAVTYTPEGGTIEVGATAGEREVQVLVHDTGRGIPADRLQEIFEPFVQVGRRYAGETQGTGLGLAISREMARGMGGDLTVESAVDEGSTFTLHLPRQGST